MGNGSKGAHASNGRTKCIATYLHLECTTGLTLQKIEATVVPKKKKNLINKKVFIQERFDRSVCMTEEYVSIL